MRLVGQLDDVDDAVVAASAGAGRELVGGVADEHDAAPPAPVLDHALLEVHQPGLAPGLVHVGCGEAAAPAAAAAAAPTLVDGQVAPAGDEGVLVGLHVPLALARGLVEPLVDANHGRLLAGEQLKRQVVAVRLHGVAGVQALQRREADPEGAVRCQKRLLVVYLRRQRPRRLLWAALLQSKVAHVLAYHAVGTVGPDNHEAFVGRAVSALDDDAVRGGSDIHHFLVWEQPCSVSRWEGVPKHLHQVVPADDARIGTETWENVSDYDKTFRW